MKKNLKFLISLSVLTIGLCFPSYAQLESKSTSAAFFNGQYYEVPFSTYYAPNNSTDSWYEEIDEEGNSVWYYLKGTSVLHGFQNIDGKTYLFDEKGKWLDENKEEYKNYISLLDSIYTAKKNNDINFSIDCSGMSEFDKNMILLNYNNRYLLSENNLNYNGLKIENDKIIITNYDTILEDKCSDLLKQLTGIETLNLKQKCKQIHDVVVNNFDYDYSLTNFEGIFKAYSNGNNKIVCGGYADVFRKLCNKFNIECDVIEGYGDGEGHVWNRISTGSGYKYIDCTWDDTEGGYNWFYKTYNEFIGSHIPF